MSESNLRPKVLIGRAEEMIVFGGSHKYRVCAKIDTGADRSSIWASNLHMTDDHELEFTLFGEGSPHYTGQVLRTKEYGTNVIRSSNGMSQVRFTVKLRIVLGGRTIKSSFTLADRSANIFPVLIGCRTLQNKFIVDVSKGRFASTGSPLPKTKAAELQADPKAFFIKYHANNQRGDLV